ncbi:hypothetical protein WICPIJ_007102 [Wickerhamomyces pijperi]|uniref:TRUD domain-containing protein n=1 Tax=Wickerhamomyces pijperi TaxID=599730 RepID=A0A9P8Q297_WICPI|nr:hypothetical protein WICPIJ_007102 [Wickerhamomyces pijperi]
MSSEKRELETVEPTTVGVTAAATEESQLKKQKTEQEQEVSTAVKPKGIQEQDVGITTYISSALPGFLGTIKQRYTDFQVNEIDLNGEVVRLLDQGIKITPKPKKEKTEVKTSDESNETKKTEEEPKTEEFQLDPAHRIELLELFGEEELTKIEELLKTAPNANASFTSTKSFESKQTRGQIHQLVRTAFQGKLETKTSADNTFEFTLNKRSSRVNKQLQQQRRDQDNKDENGVENWGAGPTTKFLHFTMYKENKETMECASLLARFLRMKPNDFRFAGTKDRRGITAQRVCLHKVRVERISNLNRTLRGIKLGGFKYQENDLALGDLKGNEFLIAIRDVKGFQEGSEVSEEDVSALLKSLSEQGFINYYGMQRFGTFSVSTHAVGKEILLSNWKSAVELILSEQELVSPDSKEARQIWSQSRDPKQTLEAMPRKCIAECAILKHLSNCKKTEAGEYSENDCFFAISKIPRNLRIMYGHAYQSYVWNCAASERVKLFGTTVIEGDLVLEHSQDSNNEDSVNVMDEDGFEEDVRKDKFQRARPLSAEEVASGKYTIFDVVLPTPGFDIKYPSNEALFNVYKDVMGKDGLNPEDMTRKVKEFSFAGSYRSLISKPANVEYFLRRYDESTDDLIYTDLELLQQNKERSEQIRPTKEDGKRLALILKFQLDTSAYATMALREIMKCDTSRHGDLCDVKV